MLEEEIHEGVEKIIWREITIRWDLCVALGDVQGGGFHWRLSGVVELRIRLGSILHNLLLLLLLLLHICIPLQSLLHRRCGRRQRVRKVRMLRGRSWECRRLLLKERRDVYPGKLVPYHFIRLVYLPIMQCRLVALVVDMVALVSLIALLRAKCGLEDARMRL